MSRPHTVLGGVYSALGASLMFAVMGTAIKAVAGHASNEMVVFLRNAFGLLFLLPGLLRHGVGVLRTRRPAAHCGRSLAGLSAMYCFFYAIAHMPLASAMLLNYSSPVFTALLAGLWLGERLDRRVLGGVFAGLTGVVLILKPGAGLWSSAAAYGLASAVLGSVAMTSIRRMSDSEPVYRIVLWFALVGVCVSAIPLAWAWQTPNLHVLSMMAAAGVSASIGQVLLTRSYGVLAAAHVGTLSYATVVFAALAGWWGWDETLDGQSACGAVLIAAAGIAVTRQGPFAGEAD